MNTHPQRTRAECLNALPKRNNFDPAEVDDVVVGCVSQAAEQGACIARNAVLLSQFPESVPGVTLNRFCGSGLQAVAFAAMSVMSGQQNLAVCGGVESMSRVPMGADGAGLSGRNPELEKKHPKVPQGISAEPIATTETLDRPTVAQFALQMTQYSDASGATRAARIPPAVFGPYLGFIPPLPVGRRQGNDGVTDGASPGTKANGGWWYNQTTGEIRANLKDDDTDSAGTPYNQY